MVNGSLYGRVSPLSPAPVKQYRTLFSTMFLLVKTKLLAILLKGNVRQNEIRVSYLKDDWVFYGPFRRVVLFFRNSREKTHARGAHISNIAKYPCAK